MADEKDWWDKTDIIAKIITSFVLAIFTISLGWWSYRYKEREDEKAAVLKKKESFQSSIGSLSERESKSGRDITLIAMDSLLAEDRANEEDKQYVDILLKIAKYIYENGTNSEDRKVAYQILDRRDHDLASQIEKDFKEKFNSTNTPQKDVISSADEKPATDKDKPTVGGTQTIETVTLKQNAPSKEAQQISAVFPQIIYIQYQDENQSDMANKLKIALNVKPIFAPGIELVPGKYKNSVRYFNTEDKIFAKQISDRVNEIFNGCGIKFEPVMYSNFKTPKGQIEVWINCAAS